MSQHYYLCRSRYQWSAWRRRRPLAILQRTLKGKATLSVQTYFAIILLTLITIYQKCNFPPPPPHTCRLQVQAWLHTPADLRGPGPCLHPDGPAGGQRGGPPDGGAPGGGGDPAGLGEEPGLPGSGVGRRPQTEIRPDLQTQRPLVTICEMNVH